MTMTRGVRTALSSRKSRTVPFMAEFGRFDTAEPHPAA
jgi:hypothetical protein